MEAQALLLKRNHQGLQVIARSHGEKRRQTAHEKAPIPGFEGPWRSPGGSLYIFEKGCFICVSIHSARFVGWLNKVAVKDVRQIGDRWVGEQAFRNPGTGSISQWVTISLELYRNKVIKYFPANIPGDVLVHGHIEIYNRVLDT